MRSRSVRLFALLIGLASLSACDSSSTSSSGLDAGSDSRGDSGTGDSGADDSGVDEPETLQCPAPLVAPPTVGCDGVLLTAEASIDQQSDGIAISAGPDGSAALTINNDQSIDLKDEGCLQLGKQGADFSLSMWLKATGDSQIIGTTSQYGRQQGFVLFTTRRSDGDLELVASAAPAVGPMVSVASAPFKAGVWTHVALRYDNDRHVATFSIDVNLSTRSGQAAPDVYNERLRIGDEGWGGIAAFEISQLSSYGRLLSDRELRAMFLENANSTGLSKDTLSEALKRLKNHVTGQAPLTPTELTAEAERFAANVIFLDLDIGLMREAIELVSRYETTVGPLFMTEDTKNGIPRIAKDGDGLELARAMLSIQQVVLEHVYTPENVKNCRLALLDGARFLTADYFPGAANPPVDPTKSYEVSISAKLPAFWGRPVAFATEAVRRPTGLYLSPGSIGKVTVPMEMVGAGYSVLVGAHTADHSSKSHMNRLDRVSRTFPITSKHTYIANPLGGGVYIVVPYLADLGVVKVSISGVIEAPFFSLKSFDKTTAEDWKRRRTAPGPWADFETDKFMMQVPSSWIYAYEDPQTLMETWDKAMDGFSELLGYPPEKRNRTVLYQQVDTQIRHGAYGIGYPQINNTYNPHDKNTDGNANNWLLTDPTAFEVDFHELGHAELISMFRGETESIVNFPHAYMRNVKFGVDFDQAFRQSFGPSYGALGYAPDDAATNWMVTENFRNGREMDHSNTESDEFRYQQRGYAKYADVYRIFGWDALRNFFHQEHLDYMAGTPSDGLADSDSRILRMSVAAGADLTPLIHFWGIHPVNPSALAKALADRGVPSSQKVRAHIERYKTTAPKNNADFTAHFERVHPGQAGKDPEWWYDILRSTFNEGHAAQIQSRIQAILSLYYP